MSTEIATSYQTEFIQAGDDVSKILKKASIEANKTYSYLVELYSLEWHNVILNHPLVQHSDAMLESQTDGVGTKVRIYMRQYNVMYEAYKRWDLERETFEATANELMYRMMLDLYAMIVDDFRDGHIAISVTDIIDINHIKIDINNPDKEQGIVWANAMKYAIENVIKETQIALIAGETAVMGAGDNEVALRKMVSDLTNRLLGIEDYISGSAAWLQIVDNTQERIKDQIKEILNPEGEKTVTEIRGFAKIIEGRMELNIGGSGNGVLNWNRLIDKKAGDDILVFCEKKTPSGIISPRANGISAIRKLEDIFGDDWTNKTITDFFDHPAISEKPGAAKLKQKFIDQWPSLDTKIWDVATWCTTIYNPFISRVLLGGTEKTPDYEVSWLAHMTGNPPRKLAELIGDKNLNLSIDYSDMEIPQIVEMCMLAFDISFEDAFSMWNMGIPYIVIADSSDSDVIIQKAREHGFTVKKKGTISNVEDWWEPMVIVKHGNDSKRFPVKESLI